MKNRCGAAALVSVALFLVLAAPVQRGQRIFFVSDRDGNREIYAMDADGSNQVNLSRHPGRDQAPAISKDGGAVAFVSDRSGALGIWVMGADGADPRLIAEVPEADFGLEWSPDGSALALSLQSADRTHDIAILGVGDGRVTRLTDTEAIEELTPAWAPDGEYLYYVRDEGTGSALVARSLADGQTRIVAADFDGVVAFPKPSPDGRYALLRTRRAEQFDVLLVDLETGAVENVTEHAANDWGASWSRDGASIVFASDRDGDFEIYTTGLARRALRQVTHNEARDWMPVW